MLPTYAEVFDQPIMAAIELSRHLYKSYRSRGVRRAARKECEDRGECQNQELWLDEALAAIEGHGIGASNECYPGNIDARFEENPIGVGCSRSFELPAPSPTTTQCNTSPRWSTGSDTIVQDDDPLSLPRESDISPRRDRSDPIDWTREKRKGRAADGVKESGATAKDYKRYLKERERQAHLSRGRKVFRKLKLVRGFSA